jgi:hypothetical protein
MLFAILNHSSYKDIPVTAIAAACQKQLVTHYATGWRRMASTVRVVTDPKSLVPGTCPVVLLDNADQAGALGYHDVTPAGLPYSKIFVKTIMENGGTYIHGPDSLSVTISHEILETVEDPYAWWWSDAPDGRQYALELCDPVEADCYDIGGVSVSNFVLPAYFSSAAGPYDYLKKLAKPFTMTAGGYLIVRDPGGQATQIFGDAYQEWKKPTKQRILKRA